MDYPWYSCGNDYSHSLYCVITFGTYW